MDLEFQDLTFTIRSPWFRPKEADKLILKGISGRFKSGELSAILGQSGAGKSSLLNAISGYRSGGIGGKLLVNGQPRDGRRFRKMSCFIVQEDLHQYLMTLNELMMLAATLKLPMHYTKKQKTSVVEEVQSMLGLESCKDTMTDCLSGGQKKRLSIALELINNPPIIFMDEPTSGLDNVTAANLVRLLRDLAEQGRTIVCTIHQPSASIFQLFHSVYVMSQGLCIYHGDTNELVPFLSSVGLNCPTHYNPADFIIEITGQEFEENIEPLSLATNNGKIWRKKEVPSEIENITLLATEDHCEKVYSFNVDKDKKLLKASILKYQARKTSCLKEICAGINSSWWIQFYTILKRMFLQMWRNKTALALQFFHHILCGLMVGFVFHGLGNNGSEFFNQMKFCVGIVVFHTYTYTMVPILAFPFEVELLKREHFNQWYGLGPYFMALTISKIPTMIIFNAIFLVLVYSMSGLPWQIYRFFLFSLIGILVSFVGEGMGLAVGSVFSVTNGTAVGPLTLAPFLGLAIYGFDFAKDISWYMASLMKSSFMRAGIIALIITMFGLDREPLDCYDPMYCHFKDPKVTLHYLDVTNVSVWSEIGVLCILLVFFRLAGYLGLKWRLKT